MNSFLKKVKRKKKGNKNDHSTDIKDKQQKDKELITDNFVENLDKIKKSLGTSFDIVYREFIIGGQYDKRAAVIHINGLSDKDLIHKNILKPLMVLSDITEQNQTQKKSGLLKDIKENMITVSDIKSVYYINDAIDAILTGQCALFIDEFNSAFIMDTRQWNDRAVNEPAIETTIRGPKEGFTETLQTNSALLRRRIKTPKLKFEKVGIGKFTKTDILITYIQGIANDKIIKEIKTRLSRIDIDGILDSGYIEQFIEDEPFSLFSTIGITEKPDVAVAKLLEGRIILLVDGSPSALTIPFLFVEALQSSEDYYTRPWFATFSRIIRIFSLLIVMFLPGFYIAAQTFHHEMLPTHLFITMAASKEGTPFYASAEILLMSLLFEILKEAGIRMPKHIGQAVSIVGALVLGEAAVQAGFVSHPAVMITALAGIASFVIYSLDNSVTILRFVFIILGSIAGLFGILIGIIFLLIHLVSIRSFGTPYMSPIAPRTKEDLKDVGIRAPLWMMNTRPRAINWKYSRRNKIDKLKYKK